MPPAKKLNPYQEERARANQRRYREETCRRCGRPILVGLDNDVLALTARVDPERLSAAEELIARSHGRRTYRVRPGTAGSGFCLWLRDRFQILGEPAQVGDGPQVVAAHRCVP